MTRKCPFNRHVICGYGTTKQHKYRLGDKPWLPAMYRECVYGRNQSTLEDFGDWSEDNDQVAMNEIFEGDGEQAGKGISHPREGKGLCLNPRLDSPDFSPRVEA